MPIYAFTILQPFLQVMILSIIIKIGVFFLFTYLYPSNKRGVFLFFKIFSPSSQKFLQPNWLISQIFLPSLFILITYCYVLVLPPHFSKKSRPPCLFPPPRLLIQELVYSHLLRYWREESSIVKTFFFKSCGEYIKFRNKNPATS